MTIELTPIIQPEPEQEKRNVHGKGRAASPYNTRPGYFIFQYLLSHHEASIQTMHRAYKRSQTWLGGEPSTNAVTLSTHGRVPHHRHTATYESFKALVHHIFRLGWLERVPRVESEPNVPREEPVTSDQLTHGHWQSQPPVMRHFFRLSTIAPRTMEPWLNPRHHSNERTVFPTGRVVVNVALVSVTPEQMFELRNDVDGLANEVELLSRRIEFSATIINNVVNAISSLSTRVNNMINSNPTGPQLSELMEYSEWIIKATEFANGLSYLFENNEAEDIGLTLQAISKVLNGEEVESEE